MKKILVFTALLFFLISANLFAQNELGMSDSLPPNFPNDIPHPNNSKYIGFLSTSDGTTVSFESTDNASEIFDFYKNNMKENGFTVSEKEQTIIGDAGGYIVWEKDMRQVNLIVSYDADRKKSSVVITY
jgi:hypothetical protein